MSRYLVVEGSQSSHCCFGVTVVDTTRPVIIGGEHGVFGSLYDKMIWFDTKYGRECRAHNGTPADILRAVREARNGVS